MNVLHIGLMVNPDKNIGLSKAFRDKSSNYCELTLTKNLPNELAFLPFKPDIIFLQIHHNKIDGYDTVNLIGKSLRKLKNSGCFIINWNGDIRNQTPNWMVSISENVNLTCFTNYRDIKFLRQKGINSDFLQIGIDTETFKKWDEKKGGHDVVFMGNHYGHFPLSQYRMDASRIIRNYNSGLYGNYPGSIRQLNPDPRNPHPIQSTESKVYSGSKIAISISHYDVEGYTSDRLLRCMGSGIFTLAKYFPRMEEQFSIGEHLDVFKNHSEMQNKIKYYLDNVEKRQKIAENGYKHVQKNFSYQNMVDNIFKLRQKYA